MDLGADATNAAAVARIYAVKGSPADHPLIVHVGDMQDIAQWSDEIPDYAIALARTFWPGPMTLILKRITSCTRFHHWGTRNSWASSSQPCHCTRTPE